MGVLAAVPSSCHDVVVVGAGPVGAALALALADADLDVVVLDARPAGESLRGDRSLALSHGARLILERLGVWAALAPLSGAVTPIVAIDVSQAGGFGSTTLAAAEAGLPALGYVRWATSSATARCSRRWTWPSRAPASPCATASALAR